MINIVTSDHLPDDIRITEVLGAVEATVPVQISQQGILQARGERDVRHIQHAALAALAAVAPQGATIIYGVRISTAVGSFSNGAFLYITMLGTAAVYETL